MAFRADEAAERGLQEAKNYLLYKGMSHTERRESEEKLLEITENFGPVIDVYPSWHPLVTHHDAMQPVTYPSPDCGYHGLDHTVTFANAFVTCPYNHGEKIFESIKKLNDLARDTLAGHFCWIKVERLDVKFYADGAYPVLISCEWLKDLEQGQMIPSAMALPLMLQKELPCCMKSSFGETWETMRPFFLGTPHGSRSSLFIAQDTALIMKKTWELLTNTGMFGQFKDSARYKSKVTEKYSGSIWPSGGG